MNFAAERFLRGGDWREAMADVLGHLGEATGVDRIVVFENAQGENGEVLISRRYEWTNDLAYARPEGPLQNIPLRGSGFSRWIRLLEAGRIIAAHVRDLPACERPVLRAQSLRSVVAVPIFVGADWWGFIGFDACAVERAWSSDDVDALSAAARILGEAIHRERAEAALRASESRYRTLAESAQDAIFIVDPDLRIAYVNQCGAAWLSASPAGVIGRTLGEVFGPVTAERFGSQIKRVIAGDGPAYVEGPGDPFAGKSWLGTRFVPLRGDDGRVSACLGISRDLSDRWRAEQARREGEARLQALAETVDDAVVVANARGEIVLWNRGAERLFQYELKDILGRPISALFPESFFEVQSCDAPGSRSTAKGHAFGRAFEAVGIRRDGARIPVELALALWQEADGRFIGAIIRDITARKEADTVLRQREADLREAQRVARLGSWEWTIETGAVNWSDEQCRLHGLDLRSAATRLEEVERFPTPEGWKLLRTAMDECRNTGAPFELDLQRVRVDGTTFWATTRGEAVRDTHGRITGIRGTVLDITQRKLAEDALRESEARLRQAQKMEAVGQLAGGIAHDFNNLLTAICGYADFAMEALPDGSPIRSDIAEIRKAGDRAAALTRQLLAFGRKQVVQPRVLDLGHVFGEVEAMLRRVIGENIRLTTTIADGLWPVVADPGQIEQILLNLAVNSRDAMADGGTLGIEVSNVEWDDELAARHQEARPGRHVIIAVRDTGCGMTPEVKARIFEPFFTTKELGKGTGLGLSTVYGIVKQTGGVIDVETAVGRGTTFRIYLPAYDGDAAEVERTARVPADPVPSARRAETVLLVEDDPSVRVLASRTLESHGHRVLEAQNSDEALALLDRHTGPIHLLITDIVMPGMNGNKLARQVARRRPDTRILLMSGYSDAIQGGGDQKPVAPLLAKPFTPAALLAAVRQVLDEPGPPASLRA